MLCSESWLLRINMHCQAMQAEAGFKLEVEKHPATYNVPR
jgi:hypothetical protein